MEWTQLFTIALGAILVNNFIVAQFLGICPCACRHLSRPCPRAWACLSP